MITNHSLSRQILLAMAAVTIIAVLIVIVGIYLAFIAIVHLAPGSLSEDSLVPSGTELLVYAALAFLALLVAGHVSVHLAARILVPLNSLAGAAQNIAAGDLTARAVPGDASLGETAHLVADFNTMAERLEAMGNDVVYWNAAIAHELRTPLTILKGRLQGIADGVFEPEPDLIANLLLQVDGLSRLVDDLRTVTLADSGNLDLRLFQVELADEVRKVADVIGPSFSEDGFTLQLSLVALTARVDPVRIRQALLALLSNARRYATPGNVEISILKSGSNAILRVEDTGPGLPREFVEQAFRPFSRADASRSRRSGGSGLGLSIVRAIAEAHGGSASCRNSSRGGAVFEMSFPRGLLAQC